MEVDIALRRGECVSNSSESLVPPAPDFSLEWPLCSAGFSARVRWRGFPLQRRLR